MNFSRCVAAAALAALMLVAGCSSTGRLAPVTALEAGNTKPGSRHTVRKGESVYAIAWRYGFDYQKLAAWNGLRAPYTIYPGQTLRLKPPQSSKTTKAGKAAPKAGTSSPKIGGNTTAKPKTVPAKAKPKPKVKPKPKAKPKPKSTAKAKPVSAAKIDSARMGKWQWPTKGKVIGTFSKSGGKGVDIAGRAGQPVRAAHAGLVVYDGSGLIGYGKLIIIKHNKRFLSAYAHNSAVHVKEGDLVNRGQRIADMGSSGTDRVKLHFEVRRDGKPVNPLKYLPR